MTNRQKKLGVTEYGYQTGIVDGNWMRDIEAFAAKLATLRRGRQYSGADIIRAWLPAEYAEYDSLIYSKLEECIPYLNGLSYLHPEAYYYTNTHGLDLLTVK